MAQIIDIKARGHGVSSSFVTALSDGQADLYLFIMSLMGGDREASKDVLQETNLRLWEQRERFDPSRGSFLTWARAIARAQVQTARTLALRENAHVVYAEDIYSQVTEIAEKEPEEKDSRLSSLHFCMGKLKNRDQRLLHSHYIDGRKIVDLAKDEGVAPATLKMRFSRLRDALANCIRKRMCRLAAGAEMEKTADPLTDALEDVMEQGASSPSQEKLNLLLREDSSRLFHCMEQQHVHAMLALDAQHVCEKYTARRARLLLFTRQASLAAGAIAALFALFFLGYSAWFTTQTPPKTRRQPPQTAFSGSVPVKISGSVPDKTFRVTEISGSVPEKAPEKPFAGSVPRKIAGSVPADSPFSGSVPEKTFTMASAAETEVQVNHAHEGKNQSQQITTGDTMNKKTAEAILTASILATASYGEIIDLAGTNATVNSLSGNALYTNSSATVSTLLVDVGEDAAPVFSGILSGNIALVKTGAGTQILSTANTFTGGTTVSNGFLSVDQETALGANDVTFAGGGVLFTNSFTLAKTYAIADGTTGCVSVVTGKTVTVSSAQMFKNNLGKTFVKAGKGTLMISDPVGVVSTPTRWIVQEGRIVHYGSSLFGNHSTTTTNLVLDIREGAIYRIGNIDHNPIGVLELTGGTFDCPNAGGWTPLSNTAFKGGIIAHACATPSVVNLQAGAFLNHGDGNTNTEFRVEDGAVLKINGTLINGYTTATSRRLNNRLIKTGAGDLYLSQDNTFTGGMELQGGRIFANADAAFSTGDVIVSQNSEVSVNADTLLTVSGNITGSGTLAKSGAGTISLTSRTDTPIRVTAGTLAVPAYATLAGSTITFSAGTYLAMEDFEASFSAARTAYPALAGILNTSSALSLTSLAFTPAAGSFAIGSIRGTSLNIGAVSGVTTLNLVGQGVTTIGSISDATAITVAENTMAFLPTAAQSITTSSGVAFFGDSKNATLATLTMRGVDKTVCIPKGTSVTIGSISLSDGATLSDIHKSGDGTLILPDADNLALFNKLYLEGGTVQLATENNLGAGSVYFKGGNLALTASYTQSRVHFVFNTDGAIHVAPDTTLSISSNYFYTAGTVFTKTGKGTLVLSSLFGMDKVGHSTWVIEEGTLIGNLNDIWGGHTFSPTCTLELHEGTVFKGLGHLPMCNLILRGATLLFAGNMFASSDKLIAWKSFAFNHNVTVLPSSNNIPSLVDSYACHIGHGTFLPVFNVREGAELQMDTLLYPGWDSSVTAMTPGSFVKTGKGTMTIKQAGCLSGTIQLQQGTLRFAKTGSLGPAATLVASPGTSVVLEDGAVLDCAFKKVNSFLGSAEVWVDAADISAENGASLATVPNLGSAGGVFSAFTSGTIPGLPTFVTNAINGKTALDFNGYQALLLKAYTNTSAEMTVFLVAKRTSYNENGGVGGYGKWGGPLSLMTASSNTTDNSTAGSFHIEDGSEFTHRFSCGDGAAYLSPSASTGTPYLDFYQHIATASVMSQYTNETMSPLTGSFTTKSANFNIDRAAIGGRLTGETAQYSGNPNTNNRMFFGQIGELLIFSHALTDEEKNYVNAYLKEKWFSVANTNNQQNIFLAAAETNSVLVRVDSHSTASIVAPFAADAGYSALSKTGAGTLQLGNAAGTNSILVNEGTLALIPTSVVSKIDIWMDAADSNSMTFSDGHVSSVRNKGGCGGRFTLNTRKSSTSKTPTLPALSTAINNLSCLSFDGTAALALDTYINTNANHHITIFLIAKRSTNADLAVEGLGKWGGPFSLASTKDATNNDNTQKGAFHYEETSANNTTIQYFYNGSTILKAGLSKIANGIPFLFMAYSGSRYATFAMEVPSETAGSASIYPSAYIADNYTPAAIDVVQLGGRLGPNGSPQYWGTTKDRMWLGHIGEFIVCTEALTDDDKAAILGYLRAKWMAKGEVPALPPKELAGSMLAPAFGTGTMLVMAQDTALHDAAATQPLASLTVTGPAAWERSGFTAPAAYTMFNVAGNVTLPASMTFTAATIPATSTALVNYTGTLNTAGTAWTVNSPNKSLRIRAKRKAIWLSRSNGTVVMLR